MRIHFYLFAIVIFLSGCVSNDIERVKRITNDESILVLSQFPNEMQIKTVGTTVFGNDLFYMDIRDWQLNDYVENKFKSLVSNDYSILTNPSLRFEVARPDYNYFTLEKYPLKNDKLAQYVNEENIRYVLLISPMKYKADPYYGTNQHINDFGVYQRSQKIVFLQMHFWLYDAVTGGFVASGAYGGYNDSAPSWISSQNLGVHHTFTSVKDIDENANKKIENGIKRLFDVLLPRNVEALKFKPRKT